MTTAPWTDAHRREAFARLRELAIDSARAGSAVDVARVFVVDATHWTESEERFRQSLANCDIGPARIDREVALVRERAERSMPPANRMDATDGPTCAPVADHRATSRAGACESSRARAIKEAVKDMRERAAKKLEEIVDREFGDDPWGATALKGVASEIRTLPLTESRQ